jgi:hypothetical protein
MKRHLIIAAAVASVLIPPVFGVPDSDKLRDSELRQQQLRSDTQAVGEQLDAVIGEFERNGLGNGQDVQVLRQIRDVLGKLSLEEMRKVVEYLQAARGTEDASQSNQNVRDAHASQQKIVAELRTLLAEYQRQQGLQALATRLNAKTRS